MGFTKRLIEDELERGYRLTGDFVCSQCFEDDAIRDFISAHLTEHECSFCDRSSEDEVIACPLDDIIEHMMTCVGDHYSDAEAESVPYDNEDQKYIVKTFDLGPATGRARHLPHEFEKANKSSLARNPRPRMVQERSRTPVA